MTYFELKKNEIKNETNNETNNETEYLFIQKENKFIDENFFLY